MTYNNNILSASLVILVFLTPHIFSQSDLNNSMTFVIDDSHSMHNDITQVRLKVISIIDTVMSSTESQIKHFVLVTFNDPDVKLVTATTNRKKFMEHLDSIEVQEPSSNDCPEYSLSGIEKAIEKSRPGSYIYVFTDASSKDYVKYETVKQNAVEKGVQIVFFLTGYCYPTEGSSDVYYRLAKDTTGQVFHMHKDELGQIVKVPVKKLGVYNAKIKSDSVLSVDVPATNTLHFQIGFSRSKPKNIEETKTRPPAAKPEVTIFSDKVANQVFHGSSLILTCKVQASSQPDIQWTNSAGGEVPSLNIEQISAMNYVKRLKLTNIVKSDKYTCLASNSAGSTAKSYNVKVNTVAKPEITIFSDKVANQVFFGRNLTLTCKVQASSQPDIQWTNSAGGEVSSLNVKKIAGSKFVKKLKLTNVTKSDEFYCTASNSAGRTLKSYKINVKSYFNSNNTKVQKSVDYGAAVELRCDLKSSGPVNYKWFKIEGADRVELKPSKSAQISPDRNILKIKNASTIYSLYECRASHKENEIIYATKTFNVTTHGQKPKIDQSSTTITAIENEPVVIKCKILKAFPKAKIVWKFKSMKSGSLQTLSENGESITIENVGLNNAGLYTCEATNIRGTDYKNINLIVKAKPVVTITSDMDHMVEYKSNVTLTCTVTAFPKPDIIWTNSSTGRQVRTQEMKAEGGFEYSRQLFVPTIKRSNNYVCTASNDMGDTVKNYSLTVTSPFKLYETTVNRTVNYGDAVELSCDIEASIPVKYSWFIKHGDERKGVEPTNNVTVSSDGRNLTIKNALFINESHECRASIIGDEAIFKTKTFNLTTLRIAPEIDQSNGTITAKENSTVNIKCSITSGQPKPDIKWRFANGTTSAGETITIKNVALDDAGKYTCQAENLFGVSNKTVELIVTAAPQILKSDTSVFVLGTQQFFNLSCRITKGTPKPEIRWQYKREDSKDYGELTDKTEDIKVKRPSPGTYEYKCIAENDAGIDEKIIEVIVLKNNQL